MMSLAVANSDQTQVRYYSANVICDDRRIKALMRYHTAVERAKFLTQEQKGKWFLMGYTLGTAELYNAERVIIHEDLKYLKTRQQLSKLKSKKNKKIR